MTSGNGQPHGGFPAGRADSGLSYVPVAWLVFVVALSVHGLISAWPLIGEHDLPDSALYLVEGNVAAGIVTILWGLYMLGLAIGRSMRFPRHFIVWQIATIVLLLARQAYVLAVPDFVFSARGLAVTGAEIAIGLLCIYLLRRGSGAETVYANPETESPPVFVSLIAAVLGIVLGAAVGGVAGFFAGSVIADVAEMSCFEGACGYFALFIGVAGLIVGAIGGGVFAVWRVHRRKRKPVARA